MNQDTGTRSRILEAAGQVFARKGFRAASLDEVAAAAGLTKGAIYWHFRSKNDLFFALVEARFQEHTAPLHREIDGVIVAGDPRAAMTALLSAVMARLRADADWPRLYLEFMSQAREPEIRELLARFYEASWETGAAHVATLQRAGMTNPALDSQSLAIFWGALVDGLMLAWLVNPERVDHDRLIPFIVDMLFTGLGNPARPESTP
jgi:TetR/AcrR family acrAB operon transcriptional repressor